MILDKQKYGTRTLSNKTTNTKVLYGLIHIHIYICNYDSMTIFDIQLRERESYMIGILDFDLYSWAFS